MVEQTNDVLSFFNVFEKTCTFHGIQGQQLASILPSLKNEKANKIYSRLDIDTCRSYDSVKTEILRGFRLSPKAYLQKFRMMKRYGDDSYSQFLHKLKDVQNYYLESKQITKFSRSATTCCLNSLEVHCQAKLGFLWISVMSLRLQRWRN